MAVRQYLTQLGKPAVERAFNGLRKITRIYDVSGTATAAASINTSVFQAYGTADDEFSSALLVQRGMAPVSTEPNSFKLRLTEVYQEFTGGSKVSVGEDVVEVTPDGRSTVTKRYVALASEADSLKSPIGTIVDGRAVASVQINKQGVGAEIVESSISAGIISEVSSEKNNGKLLLKTITSFNEVPTTPIGYTLTDTSVQNRDGVPTYVYQFAKGEGRISYDTAFKQNGKLKIVTIRYLDTDDGTAETGELVNDDYSEQDGYTLYTKGYASIEGDGIVTSDVQTKNNGKLKLYRIVRFGTPPDAPTATIGGTVVLVQSTERQEDGFTLYDYQWAEGEGRISENVDVKNGGALTLTTVRYFGTDDGTLPDGTVISTDTTEQEGVTLTTKVYAEGDGELSTSDETRQGGKLLLRTIRTLGTAPSTPAGYTAVSTESTEQDGYTLFNYVFAKGDGRVSEKTETRQGGALTLTTIVFLGATAGGTPAGTLVDESIDQRDGYTITTRVYASGSGTISTNDDTRQGGKLLLRTIRALGTAPTTPVGYTLVSADSQEQDGYTLYNYAFAKGAGRISTDVQTKNGGALTLTNIRFLGTDDGSTPAGTQVTTETVEQDGYTITNAQYADGNGVISTNEDTKNGGALLIRTIRSLGTAPSTPSGFVVFSADSTEQDGYTLYSYAFAKGDGEISRSIDYPQSNDQGTTGITRTIIRHLTATSVGTDPTSLGGSVKIGQDKQDVDGHRIWTVTYAKGTGLVTDDKETRQGGKLIVYHRVSLGAAPTSPSATITGTVVLIESRVRKEAGFDVYDYTYAEGKGSVISESNISKSGVLVIYREVSLGVAPTTPSATITGTVTAFETNVRQENGHAVYDYRYAEGKGQAGLTTRGREDGSLVYTVTDYAATATTPAYPGTGTAYLVELDQEPGPGYFVNRATYIKPPADATYRKRMQFQVPGLASFSGTQLVLSPPVTRTVLASIEVTFGTTQDTTAPWGVLEYASFYEYYTPTSTGTTKTNSDGLGGYLSAGATLSSITPGDYRGVPCDSFAAEITASDPTTLPGTGTVLDVDNDPYLTALDGTMVYRRTVTTADL